MSENSGEECKGCNPCTRQATSTSTTNDPATTQSNNNHHESNNNNNLNQKPTPITLLPSSALSSLDAIDIFDAIRDIRDPERPNTLEELSVIADESFVEITPLYLKTPCSDPRYEITIRITPTVKHCSLVADISLCIRTRLRHVFGDQVLRPYKINIRLTEGSHDQEPSVNRQINDKERVAAAMENPVLMQLIHSCVEYSY